MISLFEVRDLILLDTYTNKNTKMTCKDKEGYYYYTTLSNIKDKRTKNLWNVSKNNPYSIQNIKNFI